MGLLTGGASSNFRFTPDSVAKRRPRKNRATLIPRHTLLGKNESLHPQFRFCYCVSTSAKEFCNRIPPRADPKTALRLEIEAGLLITHHVDKDNKGRSTPSSVRVNSISPDGIATGIFAKAMGMDAAAAETTGETIKDALAKLQAIPRAGITDDIAGAAAYLGSDQSTFVNGEDIVIDGGLIWGRRFSEVMAGGHAWRQLFE